MNEKKGENHLLAWKLMSLMTLFYTFYVSDDRSFIVRNFVANVNGRKDEKSNERMDTMCPLMMSTGQ